MDSSMASLLAELPKRPELFTSASAKRAATRVTRSEGFEVFPDLHSMSPKYLALCLDLAENLSDSLPVDNNSEGVAGTNAITSDFYQLLTVAGTYMDPMTIPPKNNRAIREEYGLSDRFITTRHKQIWDSLFSLMFRSGRTSAPVKLPKRSSTCFTEFTSDIAYRQSLFNYTFENLTRFWIW